MTGTDAIPLCVDLDGTLVAGDRLAEGALEFIKRHPFGALFLPAWLLRGRAYLKAKVASATPVDARHLPYNQDILDHVRRAREAGTPTWLVTAADQATAHAIAAHLGLFDGVIASDERENIKGVAKAERLVAQFGERRFDYIGNDRADLPVWRRARRALVAGPEALAARVRETTPLERHFERASGGLTAAINAMRPHQWLKNLLVFMPLLAAHRADEAEALLSVALAFLAFCLCAASVYVTNDLLDLAADRAHPRKRMRPFASGALAPGVGFAMAPILLLAAAAIASQLPLAFGWTLATYYAGTVAYSFVLKHFVLVDIFGLAGLYTLRLIAGAAAANVPLSFWMLLFSIFLFLSLAALKRYAELHALRRESRSNSRARGYVVEDLSMLRTLGVSSGFVSVLVLGFYINSPEVRELYRRPEAIWALCTLVLYWVSRMWMKAERGVMHDDPIVFAARDWISLLVLAGAATSVLAAV